MELTENKIVSIVSTAMEELKKKWLDEMRNIAREEAKTVLSDHEEEYHSYSDR